MRAPGADAEGADAEGDDDEGEADGAVEEEVHSVPPRSSSSLEARSNASAPGSRRITALPVRANSACNASRISCKGPWRFSCYSCSFGWNRKRRGLRSCYGDDDIDAGL